MNAHMSKHNNQSDVGDHIMMRMMTSKVDDIHRKIDKSITEKYMTSNVCCSYEFLKRLCHYENRNELVIVHYKTVCFSWFKKY